MHSQSSSAIFFALALTEPQSHAERLGSPILPLVVEASLLYTKVKVKVILDVQQFSPDEITVKTVDNQVIVEAKHEEKQDEHGYVSRHFVRRYALPSSHDLVNVTSTLSSDGVLTITAPRKNVIPAGTERVISVVQTGVPAAKPVPVETTTTTNVTTTE